MAVSGCGAAFYLGTNKVASLTSISSPISRDTLDTTSFDSSCVREFIGGLQTVTIDISGYFDSTDSNGQVAMLTAMLANTILTSAQKPKILWDGTNGIEVDGIITSLNPADAAVDGLVAFTASIQGTAAITVLP